MQRGNVYLGQINKLLSGDLEELQVGSVGHHVVDELLDVAGVALHLVQVGQLLLLVLEDLEGLLQPVPEGGGLHAELVELLQGAGETLEELVRVLGDVVVADLERLPIALELVEFSSAENIGASLDQLGNDINGVVNWPVMVINIILDLLGKKRN